MKLDKKEKPKEAAVKAKAPRLTPEAKESKYSRSELVQAAASFGVRQEVVVGALRLAGKDEMTKVEAKAAIKKFLERKV